METSGLRSVSCPTLNLIFSGQIKRFATIPDNFPQRLSDTERANARCEIGASLDSVNIFASRVELIHGTLDKLEKSKNSVSQSRSEKSLELDKKDERRNARNASRNACCVIARRVFLRLTKQRCLNSNAARAIANRLPLSSEIPSYLAIGAALARRIQEDTAVLDRSVNVGDHGAHVPRAVGFPTGGILFRTYVFLDGRVPGVLVALVDAANDLALVSGAKRARRTPIAIALPRKSLTSGSPSRARESRRYLQG